MIRDSMSTRRTRISRLVGGAADRPVATLPSVAGTDTRADSCSHGLHLMPTHARDPGPGRATVGRWSVCGLVGANCGLSEPLSSLHRRVLMELSRLNHGVCGAVSGGGGIRTHGRGCTPSPVFKMCCLRGDRRLLVFGTGVWRLDATHAALLSLARPARPARVSSFLTERQRDCLVQCQLTPGFPLPTEGVAEPLAGRLCGAVHNVKRVARFEPLPALFADRLGRRE